MKTLWLTVTPLILGAAISTYALPGDDPSVITAFNKSSLASTGSSMSTLRQAQGVIDQLDPVKEVVRVRDAAGHEDAFFVDTNTPIYDPQLHQIAFEDLRSGDLVSLSLSTTDDTLKEIRKLKD